MASDKSFVDFIVDQIENAGQITYKELPEQKIKKKKNK